MQQSGQDCQDLLPAFLSHVVPRPGTRLWTRRSSVPFSVAACGSLCPRQAVFAGVAVHSTPVATTVQHVLWRGCLGVAASLWSPQPHAFAVKQVGGSPPTVAPRTWTLSRRTSWTNVASRFSLTVCFCSTERRWPWTQRWSRHCGGMEPTSMARLWTLPVEGRSSVTLSAPGDRGEHDWLSWWPKWEEGGHRRLRTFFFSNSPKLRSASARHMGT